MRVLREWWMTFRFIPVLNWTITNSIIVLALAYYFNNRVDLLSWFIAAFIAWMTQGFPAHIWNDIYDWISGTDKLVDINKSPTGGSHVVQLYYKNSNVFNHLKNHIPWIVSGIIGVYYFGIVLGWWLYVVLAAIFAVYIAVFYSAPPIQADHRPFFGEWCHAFPGILISNIFIYYAATHSIPSINAILCMIPYVTGNIFMLETHHINDIYPDLNAKPKKKYTAVSWLYENKGKDMLSGYLGLIAVSQIITSFLLGIYIVPTCLLFVLLYFYGMSLAFEYSKVNLEKYPEYLEQTVPLELKWIKCHTIVGIIFAISTFLLSI